MSVPGQFVKGCVGRRIRRQQDIGDSWTTTTHDYFDLLGNSFVNICYRVAEKIIKGRELRDKALATFGITSPPINQPTTGLYNKSVERTKVYEFLESDSN